jgi:5-deoxy-glucuronate isomerase
MIMVQDFGELKDGSNILCEVNGKNEEMLMDINVEKLSTKDKKSYFQQTKEMAILLLEGKLKISWSGKEKLIERKSVFDEDPWCLHVSKETEVTVEVLEESEVIVQCTENANKFEEKLYSPQDCQSDIFGEGVWHDTARRVVRTVFDYRNAPYSNMVMGEVITYPGKWSSYPPHHHPQPEVYYYKFNKPQGFGLCLVGEDAYKIKDHNFVTIKGGLVHPQTAAPGYAMYYCWMIRHLKNNPWTDRIDDPNHTWLWDKNVKIWPDK